MSDSRLVDRHEMIEEAAREALRFLAIDRVGVGSDGQRQAWAVGLPEIAGEREQWQDHVIGELRGALEGKEEEAAQAPKISLEGTDLAPEVPAAPTADHGGEHAEQVMARLASSKPCKACGVPKDLEEFPKQAVNRDGRAGTCKECRKEQQAARKARSSGQPEPSANDPGTEGTTETEEPEKSQEGKPGEPDPPAAPVPSEPAPKTEKRSCANGEKCVAYPQLGEPAKLGRSNNGDVCYPCADAKINGSIPPAYGRNSGRVSR